MDDHLLGDEIHNGHIPHRSEEDQSLTFSSRLQGSVLV
jgi:hypothetical protein